ncbi:MAG: hypothetical protein PHN99_02285 [Eubacteriales bacterium]|nr:hypothetical protein [Eubacteriales bacterium]MDD4327732.1 hypothetical protein [Eubacteriales bacterium]MDD4716922.1 hypothetical protein [Eubacteriales bacterium]NCU26943.1 hypothetical protein [Candidatus Nomurabacteria bacterium]
MDNTFMEKIVRKKKDSKDYLMISGLILLYIVLILLILQFIPQILILIIFAGGWGLWWMIGSTNKEYEYSVTDHFIDIDCIIAQRKRVRVFAGNAKEFEMCARVNSDLFRDFSKGNRKVLDLAPADDPARNYFIVTKNNAKKAKTKGETVMVIFEPDERMIPSLKKFNPSKIKIEGNF